MAREDEPDDDFDRRPGWQLPGSPGGDPEPAWTPPPVAPQPSPAPYAHNPPARVLPGGFAGEARNVATASVQRGGNTPSETVLTFRLEQHSPTGGRSGLVTVRLRGHDALGFVSDGDWVEVEGKLKRGFVEGRRAVNRTSAAEFKAPGRGAMGCLRVVAIVVFFVFFLGVLAFIIGIIGSSTP